MGSPGLDSRGTNSNPDHAARRGLQVVEPTHVSVRPLPLSVQGSLVFQKRGGGGGGGGEAWCAAITVVRLWCADVEESA